VATDELVNRGDELQYALGEGPCLDAIWHYDTVISANLAEEDRWTRWAPRVAAELNIRSMLALRLFTSTELVGGLNLYSKDIDAFDVPAEPQADGRAFRRTLRRRGKSKRVLRACLRAPTASRGRHTPTLE
jgi:hypothetical protein